MTNGEEQGMPPEAKAQLPTTPSDTPQGDPSAQAMTRARGKVLYKGTSHVRRISKEDFAQVDIDHDTLEWSNKNLFMVPMDKIKLSPTEFKRVIEDDPDFALVDVDEQLSKSHPDNNRFNQGQPYTEGLPGAKSS